MQLIKNLLGKVYETTPANLLKALSVSGGDKNPGLGRIIGDFSASKFAAYENIKSAINPKATELDDLINIEQLYNLAQCFKAGAPEKGIKQNGKKYAVCLALIVFQQNRKVIPDQGFDPKYLLELQSYFNSNRKDKVMAAYVAARIAELRTDYPQMMAVSEEKMELTPPLRTDTSTSQPSNSELQPNDSSDGGATPPESKSGSSTPHNPLQPNLSAQANNGTASSSSVSALASVSVASLSSQSAPSSASSDAAAAVATSPVVSSLASNALGMSSASPTVLVTPNANPAVPLSTPPLQPVSASVPAAEGPSSSQGRRDEKKSTFALSTAPVTVTPVPPIRVRMSSGGDTTASTEGKPPSAIVTPSPASSAGAASEVKTLEDQKTANPKSIGTQPNYIELYEEQEKALRWDRVKAWLKAIFSLGFYAKKAFATLQAVRDQQTIHKVELPHSQYEAIKKIRRDLQRVGDNSDAAEQERKAAITKRDDEIGKPKKTVQEEDKSKGPNRKVTLYMDREQALNRWGLFQMEQRDNPAGSVLDETKKATLARELAASKERSAGLISPLRRK